jgi:hypothetical protein
MGKTASVKAPCNEIQKPNLASVNTTETKTAKVHKAYIENAQSQKAQF